MTNIQIIVEWIEKFEESNQTDFEIDLVIIRENFKKVDLNDIILEHELDSRGY